MRIMQLVSERMRTFGNSAPSWSPSRAEHSPRVALLALVCVALSPLLVVGVTTEWGWNGLVVGILFHIISCMALPAAFAIVFFGRDGAGVIWKWVRRCVWNKAGWTKRSVQRGLGIGIVVASSATIIAWIIRHRLPRIESVYDVDDTLALIVIFGFYFVLINPIVEELFWRTLLPIFAWLLMYSRRRAVGQEMGRSESRRKLYEWGASRTDVTSISEGPGAGDSATYLGHVDAVDALDTLEALPKLQYHVIVPLSMAYAAYHLLTVTQVLTGSLDHDAGDPGEVSRGALAAILVVTFVGLASVGIILYYWGRVESVVQSVLAHAGGDLAVVSVAVIADRYGGGHDGAS